MIRPQISASLPRINNIQYDVYIYHRPANRNDIIPGWERKTSTQNIRRARLKAKSLYETDQYEKVEIKRRVFNEGAARSFSSTFKTYENTGYRKILRALLITMLGALGAIASLGVMYLTYA